MGHDLSSAKRLMPLYREMVARAVRKASLEKEKTGKKRASTPGAKKLEHAMGVKKLETISEMRLKSKESSEAQITDDVIVNIG